MVRSKVGSLNFWEARSINASSIAKNSTQVRLVECHFDSVVTWGRRSERHHGQIRNRMPVRFEQGMRDGVKSDEFPDCLARMDATLALRWLGSKRSFEYVVRFTVLREDGIKGRANSDCFKSPIHQALKACSPPHRFPQRINIMSLDLSNPGRTIQAGVILMGETEILDVAPIDFLHGITRRFITALPIPDEIKAKALDIDFHWVTEKGGPARLTGNITMQATVRCSKFLVKWTNHDDDLSNWMWANRADKPNRIPMKPAQG